MISGILPFRPVVRAFVLNVWYLRLFLVMMLVFLMGTTSVFAWLERTHLTTSGTYLAALKASTEVTIADALPGAASHYVTMSTTGQFLRLANALCGFIALGVLLWVVQTSLSDHSLKTARWGLFPGRADARDV